MGRKRSTRIKSQLYNHYRSRDNRKHEIVMARCGRQGSPVGLDIQFCCQIESNTWREAQHKLDAHIAALRAEEDRRGAPSLATSDM